LRLQKIRKAAKNDDDEYKQDNRKTGRKLDNLDFVCYRLESGLRNLRDNFERLEKLMLEATTTSLNELFIT